MTVFFFQAEDGIRDADVTGVQTCALPIFTEQEPHWAWEPLEAYLERLMAAVERNAMDEIRHLLAEAPTAYRPDSPIVDRSEERRVGKECRCRLPPDRYKKKTTAHIVAEQK